ncbi:MULTISPECIES: hypothetical protein [Enterobacteriaceae]|uniref:hypothetical protein n=1 Tax=Lelliottia amnigena TaxID=61646 RepID=UPI00115B79A1
MSEKNKGAWENFLNLRHTGKIISLLNAALYSFLSYLVIGYVKKEFLLEQDAFKLSVGIILLVLFVGSLSWFRDMITEEWDMQAPINKERKNHEQTKEELETLKIALRAKETIIDEKRKIIHAISCNLNNTILTNDNIESMVGDIKTIMTKINISKEANNLSDLPSAGAQSDYLSMFCP